MKKVLVIGSINVDLVVNVDNLPIKGQTIAGSAFNQYFGGKGANQAYAIAKFDSQTKMIGQVGNDAYGQQAIDNLKAIGIDTSAVKILDGVPTGIALITVDQHGDNEIVIVGGANTAEKSFDQDLIRKEIDQADIIVFQLEIPLTIVEQAISYAHQQNKYVILNPAPAKNLSQKMLSECNLIVPNETELATLMGVDYVDDYQVILKNAHSFAQQLGVDLLVTLGEKGSIYLDPNGQEILVKAHVVQAVDSTAAGDTFIGGFVSQIAAGKDQKEALAFATRASAIAVTRFGAQPSIPTINEVLKWNKKLSH